MRIDVLTLFPEFIDAAAAVGVIGRAQQRGLLAVRAWNPRDHTHDNYRRIDERPFGGGPGMVMSNQPLRDCLAAMRAAASEPAHTIYVTPQGARLTQRRVRELAALPRLILVCGRYEGIDERLIAAEIDEELSIGDYVLSGGELAAAVVIDAVGRLQDGALNDADSAAQDSFENGLLDCPHYTRPDEFEGESVPPVLLSGDHAAIARWRRQQSLGRTWLRRPDLLARMTLSKADRVLLDGFMQDWLRQQGSTAR
ncbi:tRNA (guanosine(37)-N1)-methyltransferase TrmD [Chiayiivirga flava]|uniref:tRNA (guanine-N(1)-)-methyltransferase n=1 Tax=Chiayiivirga flava TaxID=659595 RepID=A0A7W8G0W8_9GAMM|nr:tRNA (guanosine(37)-N1)-methyltransferase TrmD [Chiayiivirga flava]MBB5207065.1 tRNA (guanine37-N1)-methyltransferase [Chiayiivirga flava]